MLIGFSYEGYRHYYKNKMKLDTGIVTVTFLGIYQRTCKDPLISAKYVYTKNDTLWLQK